MEKLLIENARVYDGLGGAPYTGAMLVQGGKITALGQNPEALGPGDDARVIDAEGRVLCPGFIDLHRHCDFNALEKGFGKLELAQGITTTLCGPCGMSAFPAPADETICQKYHEFLRPCLGDAPGQPFADLPAYAASVKARGLPLNLGTLVGAGAVQVALNGFSAEPLSQKSLDAAVAQIGAALDAGAFGMSMGIMYVPECYLPRPQRLALLRPLRGKGTLFCHIRGEGDLLVDSVDEIISLAAEAQVPLQISHFKAVGVKNWGVGLQKAIERIEAARAKGQDVTVDFYPYTGGSTTLFSLVPPALLAAGSESALASFATPAGRKALARALAKAHPGWDNMLEAIGPGRILLSSSAAHPDFAGLAFDEITERLGEASPGEAIGRVLYESEGQAGVILMSMAPEDLVTVAKLPYSMLISDSLYASGGRPHPRLFGSFPKFLREFCGPGKALPLTEGIKKMTRLPALRAGMARRGALLPGNEADFLLFDPAVFTDLATFEDPARESRGLHAAFVAGRPAWCEGASYGDAPGMFLSRQAEQ